MDWLAFDSINWWGVLLATLSTFAVGFVWYAEGLFGKEWMGLVGITEMETNKEKETAAVAAMAMSLMSCPASSSRKMIGKKTATVVSAEAISAPQTSLVPS